MDWTQLATIGGSFILGIGGVAAFIAKTMPTIKKVLGLISSTSAFLNDVSKAIEDDNLTQTEWETIAADAKGLKLAWEAVWAK